MSSIVLLDTTIYLNVLDVPGRNQNRAAVLSEFERKIKAADHFLLPLATVWESGNHISRLSNGNFRRKYANVLQLSVLDAMSGTAPFKATHFPSRAEFMEWILEFPDYASKNKSAEKLGEGTSLSDFSIIKEWHRECDKHNLSRVLIWSLDSDLSAYDRAIEVPRPRRSLKEDVEDAA